MGSARELAAPRPRTLRQRDRQGSVPTFLASRFAALARRGPTVAAVVMTLLVTACTSGKMSSSSEDTARDGTHFRFGETATYEQNSTAAGSEPVPLQITVAPPVSFKPRRDAVVTDKVIGSTLNAPLQATSVYFVVTLRNLSKTTPFDNDFTFTDVQDTSDDDSRVAVSQDGIEGTTGLNALAPGKWVTFKDGYSVKSADNITYLIKFDGLAGKTFYFGR